MPKRKYLITELRDLLAELYSDRSIALAVVAEVGLNRRLVPSGVSPLEAWQAILDQAQATQRLVRVIDAALKQSEGNTQLLQLREEWQAIETADESNGILQPDGRPDFYERISLPSSCASRLPQLAGLSSMKHLTPSYLSHLRQGIVDTFNTEELKTLCSDLGLDYEDLDGEGKEAKIRELIAYLNRRDELPCLVKYCTGTRPAYPWPREDVGQAPASGGRSPAITRHLQQQLAELQSRYETLSQRIAALYKDLGNAMDSEVKLVLEERRRDLVAERDRIVDDMTRIELALDA